MAKEKLRLVVFSCRMFTVAREEDVIYTEVFNIKSVPIWHLPFELLFVAAIFLIIGLASLYSNKKKPTDTLLKLFRELLFSTEQQFWFR